MAWISLIVFDRIPSEPEAIDGQYARYNLRGCAEKVWSRVKPARTEWSIVETLQIPDVGCCHVQCECARYLLAAEDRLHTLRTRRLMKDPSEQLMIIGTGNDLRVDAEQQNRPQRRRYQRLFRAALRKLTRAERGKQRDVDAALVAEFEKREQTRIVPSRRTP